MAPSIIGAPSRAQTSPTGDSQSPAAAPVLKVESDYGWDYYTGTREQLIAARLVKDGQFPGDPGAGKTIARYLPDGTPTRQCRSSKVAGAWAVYPVYPPRKKLFQVSVRAPESERPQRREAAKAQRFQENQTLSKRFRVGDRARLVTSNADDPNSGLLVRIVGAVGVTDDGHVLWKLRGLHRRIVKGGVEVDTGELSSAYMRPIDYLRVISGGRPTKWEASHA